MHFPVMILGIYPHPVFEFLAFFLGFQLYRRTHNQVALPETTLIWILVGAIVGAISGSFLVYCLENPVATFTQMQPLSYYVGGKSIVGGLLGGLIGVEFAKKKIGYTKSTGDDMVIPLILGMIIGRIGCFLTGLSDHTYGVATTLPWGVNFGDGVYRHPMQIYEQLFLVCLLLFVVLQKRKKWGWDGLSFQLFMTSYFVFRLLIEEIKPIPTPYWGLDNVQVVCIAGLVYYVPLLIRKGIHHYHLKGEIRNA